MTYAQETALRVVRSEVGQGKEGYCTLRREVLRRLVELVTEQQLALAARREAPAGEEGMA